MTRALLVLALIFALAALALRRRPEPVPTCPDLSELSYGDLPSWPSVRVG